MDYSHEHEQHHDQSMEQSLYTFQELLQELNVEVLRNIPEPILTKIEEFLENIVTHYKRFHILAINGEPGAGKTTLLTQILFLIVNFEQLVSKIQERRRELHESEEVVKKTEISVLYLRVAMAISVLKIFGFIDPHAHIPDYTPKQFDLISALLTKVLAECTATLPRQNPAKTHVVLVDAVAVDPEKDVGRSLVEWLSQFDTSLMIGLVTDEFVQATALGSRALISSQMEEHKEDAKNIFFSELSDYLYFDAPISLEDLYRNSAPPETIESTKKAIITKICRLGKTELRLNWTPNERILIEEPHKFREALIAYYHYFYEKVIHAKRGQYVVGENPYLGEVKSVLTGEKTEEKAQIHQYLDYLKKRSALNDQTAIFVRAAQALREENGLEPLKISVEEVRLKLGLSNDEDSTIPRRAA